MFLKYLLDSFKTLDLHCCREISELNNRKVSDLSLNLLLEKKNQISFVVLCHNSGLFLKMNEQVTHFSNAELLLVLSTASSAWGCVSMCESSGECGLAGSVMTISAAGFYECHTPHPNPYQHCRELMWPSSLSWAQQSPQNSQHDQWPKLTQFSFISSTCSGLVWRTQCPGTGVTRLSVVCRPILNEIIKVVIGCTTSD